MPFWLRIWPFLIFALAMFISFVGYLFDFNLANIGALGLCVAVLILMRLKYSFGFAAGLIVLLVYGFRLLSYGGVAWGNYRREIYGYWRFFDSFELHYDIILLLLAVLLAVMNLREFKRLLLVILP